MRVVLVRGVSSYGATPAFTDALDAAFRGRGYDVSVVDVSDEADETAAFLRVAGDEPPTLVYSIGLYGEYRDPQGRTLGQVFGAPHVLHMVDYPLSHWNRLVRTATDTAVLVVDESHVDAVRSVFGTDHFADVRFCPHGAVGPETLEEPDAESFAARRPIPLLFAGTFYKPKPPMWGVLDLPLRRIFERAFEAALAADWLPPLEALDQALTVAGRDPADPSTAQLRLNAFAIHEQVRAHRRFALLKAAAKLRMPLHIYGAGWDQDWYRFKSFVRGGEASIKQISSLMAQARVVLNVNANFGAGSHERVFSGFRAGAAVASEGSLFYERALPKGALHPIRWSSLEEDLAGAAALSDDPERAWRSADSGRRAVATAHGWEHRIDTILAAAEAARARVTSRT